MQVLADFFLHKAQLSASIKGKTRLEEITEGRIKSWNHIRKEPIMSWKFFSFLSCRNCGLMFFFVNAMMMLKHRHRVKWGVEDYCGLLEDSRLDPKICGSPPSSERLWLNLSHYLHWRTSRYYQQSSSLLPLITVSSLLHSFTTKPLLCVFF